MVYLGRGALAPDRRRGRQQRGNSALTVPLAPPMPPRQAVVAKTSCTGRGTAGDRFTPSAHTGKRERGSVRAGRRRERSPAADTVGTLARDCCYASVARKTGQSPGTPLRARVPQNSNSSRDPRVSSRTTLVVMTSS